MLDQQGHAHYVTCFGTEIMFRCTTADTMAKQHQTVGCASSGGKAMPHSRNGWRLAAAEAAWLLILLGWHKQQGHSSAVIVFWLRCQPAASLFANRLQQIVRADGWCCGCSTAWRLMDEASTFDGMQCA